MCREFLFALLKEAAVPSGERASTPPSVNIKYLKLIYETIVLWNSFTYVLTKPDIQTVVARPCFREPVQRPHAVNPG